MIPICWTRASEAGVGPKDDCSRKRAADSDAGGGAGASSVTVARANAVALATDVAWIVTVGDAGITAGATYTPAELIVPTAVEPPVTPLTDHVTPGLVVPVNVAVNGCADPSAIEAVVGEIVTLIGVAATTLTDMVFPVTAPGPG